MSLLQEFLVGELPLLLRHRIRLLVIGETSSFRSPSGSSGAHRGRNGGEHRDDAGLGISYAGRNEIVRAARRLAAEAAEGKIAPGEITEELFSSRLDTAGVPDPDLVIRTSGELRLSNFLLWHPPTPSSPSRRCCGPTSARPSFLQALEEYSRRHRRFGLTGEQISNPPAK